MTQRFSLPDDWSEGPIPVDLIGVGGTGSEVLDGLVRMHHGLVGLGHKGLAVRVFDGDTVSTSNIGRQRFGPRDVGQNKAVTLVSRYNLFFGLDWEGIPIMADPEAMAERLHGCPPKPLVITCVDRASFRVDLADYWSSHNSRFSRRSPLWLDMGNGRHQGQVVLGDLGSGSQRLPHIVDLYPEMRDQPDDDTPSCSMAEALSQQDLWANKFASMGLALIWNLIRDGFIETHGMFFDSKAGSMQPLPISPATWALFGYQLEVEDGLAS